MSLLLNLLINGFAVFVAGYLLPGVRIDSFFTAIVVSIALAIVNTFVKPIVLFLTLPFNILTLGLFTFIINGLMVILVSTFIPGFKVQSFLWAMAFSLVLWAVNFILHSLTK
ncbi:phage holin family protein [Candidatus Roizmanbacteria bacterium]|nr:phage holin family protein [Candidatus Roizmanbacteria bacterium]